MQLPFKFKDMHSIIHISKLNNDERNLYFGCV